MDSDLTQTLAIIGALTGIVALIVTVIKELIRDRPIIKAYEVYKDKDKEGGIIRRYKDKPDILLHWFVKLHILITNSGLRTTSITKAELKVHNKYSRVELSEKYTELNADGIKYFLQGNKLDSGEYIKGYVLFIGECNQDFIFTPLRGDLKIWLSHTKRPVKKKNISIDNLITYDRRDREIKLQEVLDSSGKLKDDFVNSF